MSELLDFDSTFPSIIIVSEKQINSREIWVDLLISKFQAHIGGGRLTVCLQTKTFGRWSHISMLLAAVRKLIFVRAISLCSSSTADVCPLLLLHQQFCAPAVHKEVLMKYWSEGRADSCVHLSSEKKLNAPNILYYSYTILLHFKLCK